MLPFLLESRLCLVARFQYAQMSVVSLNVGNYLDCLRLLRDVCLHLIFKPKMS